MRTLLKSRVLACFLANVMAVVVFSSTAVFSQNPELPLDSPPGFTIEQNIPMPITIDFAIHAAGIVSVDIFNADKEKVATLMDSVMCDAGRYSVVWDTSGFPAGVYFCIVKFNDLFMTVEITLLDEEVAVEEESGIPTAFTLSQNYPNPFNPITQIAFSLPEDSHVTLAVFNSLGQQISVLTDEPKGAGQHRVSWDGTGFPSGVYFYRLSAKGFIEARKMLLMR